MGFDVQAASTGAARQASAAYYIIDDDRLSTGAEIRAMRDIKKLLMERHPQAGARLLPTLFKDLADIPPNPGLAAAFEKIKKHGGLDRQYEWLASFCAEMGIEEIELLVHRDGLADQVLQPFVVQTGAGDEPDYRLDETARESAVYALFHCFTFPLFSLTKLDMQAIARKEGFEEIMHLTWFCRQPRPGFRPCGVCFPCRHTIEAGLGRDFPLASRIRFNLYLLRRKPKHLLFRLLMKRPAFYVWLKGVKQRIIK
ncbi:MAG: hypothetical protein Q8O57_13580 [Kiritimatiellota bacterium]|nr:hypothetical protein [Kiritimatiellota bacterium]